MMIRNIPLRHELKYLITPAELTVLRNTLAPLMQLDQGHEYLIRSLYFDTINDDALEEKIAGVGNRKKYRIRIYNFSDRVIKLECKSKYGDLISKQSVSIPRELADQLIAGDPEGLQRMRHPLLHDVYREMKTRLLRPVVIVDYVREAYIHPAEEVRITFDKQIRTGLYQTDMFNPNIPTYPVFDDPGRGSGSQVRRVSANLHAGDFKRRDGSAQRGEQVHVVQALREQGVLKIRWGFSPQTPGRNLRFLHFPL